MEKGQVIELENGQKYAIADSINLDNKNYIYLVNLDNNSDIRFADFDSEIKKANNPSDSKNKRKRKT